MTATAAMPASSKKPQDVQKEDAMWLLSLIHISEPTRPY